MDAVKFLKEKRRMCENRLCDECHLSNRKNGTDYGCRSFIEKFPEKAITVVEKWSKEHPVETRQSKFLKAYPNADITEGVLFICPRRVDLNCLSEKECREATSCYECKKKYWLSKEE